MKLTEIYDFSNGAITFFASCSIVIAGIAIMAMIIGTVMFFYERKDYRREHECWIGYNTSAVCALLYIVGAWILRGLISFINQTLF